MTHESQPAPEDQLLARLRRLERAERSRRRVRRTIIWTGAAALLALPVIAEAVEVPNTFQSGDTIEAEAFNENFAALGDALTTVEDTVANLGPPVQGSSNIDVTDNVISLVDEVHTGGSMTVGGTLTVEGVMLKINTDTLHWNNAGAGGTARINGVTHTSCDEEADRGRIRIIGMDESTPDGDMDDALCFCRRYVDDTPGGTGTTYRWMCLHGPDDGT